MPSLTAAEHKAFGHVVDTLPDGEATIGDFKAIFLAGIAHERQQSATALAALQGEVERKDLALQGLVACVDAPYLISPDGMVERLAAAWENARAALTPPTGENNAT